MSNQPPKYCLKLELWGSPKYGGKLYIDLEIKNADKSDIRKNLEALLPYFDVPQTLRRDARGRFLPAVDNTEN